MQHVLTNPVWQVKTGFNKRHSRQLIDVLTNDAALHYKPIVAVRDWLQQKAQLINVSTNDAALHYNLSVAGQNGFNKRPQKVRYVPAGI